MALGEAPFLSVNWCRPRFRCQIDSGLPELLVDHGSEVPAGRAREVVAVVSNDDVVPISGQVSLGQTTSSSDTEEIASSSSAIWWNNSL